MEANDKASTIASEQAKCAAELKVAEATGTKACKDKLSVCTDDLTAANDRIKAFEKNRTAEWAFVNGNTEAINTLEHKVVDMNALMAKYYADLNATVVRTC